MTRVPLPAALLSTLVAAAASAVAVHLLAPSIPIERHHDESETEVAELRRRVAELEREAASLRRQVRRGPLPPPSSTIDGSGESPTRTLPFGTPRPVDVPAADLDPADAEALAQRALDALRQAIADGDDGARQVATTDLVRAGIAAAPLLGAVAASSGETPQLREACLEVLARFAWDRLGPVVDAVLEQAGTTPALRRHALHGALLTAQQHRTVPRSVRVLAESPSAAEHERRAALQALVAADPPAALAVLASLTASGNADDLETADLALAAADDPVFLDRLTDAVNRTPTPSHAHSLIDAIARLKDRKWSVRQLTGRPDTPVAGDLGTAWASKSGDMGEVWIELEFDRAVVPSQVRIHETFHPGAVARVQAWSPEGAWVELWSGTAARATAPHWFEPSLVEAGFATSRLRLVLDTDRVTGWNEIDAVELVGDGERQWASAATASSSYAD